MFPSETGQHDTAIARKCALLCVLSLSYIGLDKRPGLGLCTSDMQTFLMLTNGRKCQFLLRAAGTRFKYHEVSEPVENSAISIQNAYRYPCATDTAY